MTVRLGLLGRADEGGLAALTCELARHLKPAVCVVVDLHDGGRGRFDLNRLAPYCDRIAVAGNPLDDQAIGWLLRHCDVLYTAETTYHPELHARCRLAGVKLVLHAMPELHRAGTTADLVLNPTAYGADRVKAMHLPVPVARDRITYGERTEARTFLHVASPAMLDRNGTMLVELALAHIKHPCRVLVANADPVRVGRYAPRHVEVLAAPRISEYWQRWTPDIDVLLMPRRYAGLCLPAQEAAAAGIPTIVLSTDLALAAEAITIPGFQEQIARFAGGSWPVHGCLPIELACTLNALLEEPGRVQAASKAADAWATAISWERQLPAYEELFGTS